jgi:hypothetical protein
MCFKKKNQHLSGSALVGFFQLYYKYKIDQIKDTRERERERESNYTLEKFHIHFKQDYLKGIDKRKVCTASV